MVRQKGLMKDRLLPLVLTFNTWLLPVCYNESSNTKLRQHHSITEILGIINWYTFDLICYSLDFLWLFNKLLIYEDNYIRYFNLSKFFIIPWTEDWAPGKTMFGLRNVIQAEVFILCFYLCYLFMIWLNVWERQVFKIEDYVYCGITSVNDQSTHEWFT
jgi:hypothetical protein